MRKFLLLFAALPLLDLYVLYQLGKLFGGGVPVMYVLVVGLCGVWLMRATGLRVVGAWRHALAEGKPPDEGVVSGGLLFLGCALVIMPGVISDALGIGLFIPVVRRAIARRVNRGIREAIERGTLHVAQTQTPFAGVARDPRVDARRSVIDVEAEVVEDGSPPRQLRP